MSCPRHGDGSLYIRDEIQRMCCIRLSWPTHTFSSPDALFSYFTIYICITLTLPNRHTVCIRPMFIVSEIVYLLLAWLQTVTVTIQIRQIHCKIMGSFINLIKYVYNFLLGRIQYDCQQKYFSLDTLRYLFIKSSFKIQLQLVWPWVLCFCC